MKIGDFPMENVSFQVGRFPESKAFRFFNDQQISRDLAKILDEDDSSQQFRGEQPCKKPLPCCFFWKKILTDFLAVNMGV